ncbi:MAG: HNH endonuclease [Patescibacteria group bacterium]|nr:HNH endonuclease [Patescibacteria group bacterium]
MQEKTNIDRLKEQIQKEQDICKKYQEGSSTLVLGKEYNVSYTTINKILKINNIALRNHSEKTINAYKTGKMDHMVNVWQKASKRWLGENNPRWRKIGDIKYDTQGYAIIKTENGWIERARVVAEKKLGRKLKKEEIIHHINYIKNDDRVENLYLFKNGKEHRQYHGANRQLKIIGMNKLLLSNL